MNIEELLSQRINMPQVNDIVAWASRNNENLNCLWASANSDDRRTSTNSLWVMTHLPMETKTGLGHCEAV